MVNCNISKCNIAYAKGEVKVNCATRKQIQRSANNCQRKKNTLGANNPVAKSFCQQANVYRKAKTAEAEAKCGVVGGKKSRRNKTKRSNKSKRNTRR